MPSHAPPSPPCTQNLPIDCPSENLRSWLSKHGVSSNEVDRLWEKHNHRQHTLDQEYQFLVALKNAVTARKVEWATPTDLQAIDVDFGLAALTQTEELKREAKRAVSAVALDTVRLLPDEVKIDFLNFLKSDSVNARHRFLARVLPCMTRSLKRKRLDDGDGDGDATDGDGDNDHEDDSREQKQPQPKRARINQPKANTGEPQGSRRSASFADEEGGE
ncbi:hypothetical protein FQN55_008065 [Onygenales sp. PD_40]|nr:hypothetical protein FQN55_008065 [Onygenales sp. PD_40]KAK2779492.1 hypothetical protein FQN52_002425 [Onygenales sp. PD_12]KAK2790288.1 hypothetical protein FQN53_000054 [Emmonsiellopsis sp. PD_33]KAK2806603.1 hypothetical protein FQN51_006569 [Onygenales sp. PD_10]